MEYVSLVGCLVIDVMVREKCVRERWTVIGFVMVGCGVVESVCDCEGG